MTRSVHVGETEARYVIGKAGAGTYYAINKENGVVEYTSVVSADVVIQAVIDHIDQGVIQLTEGNFVLAAPLTITGSIHLRGAGRALTILDGETNSINDYCIKVIPTAAALRSVEFCDFGIYPHKDGMLMQNVWNPRLDNIQIGSDTGTSFTGVGLYFYSGQYGVSGAQARKVIITNGTNGFSAGATHATGFISLNTFTDCSFVGMTTSGIAMPIELGFGAGGGIATNTFTRAQIEVCNWGARLDPGHLGMTNTTFIDCVWDTCTTNDLMNWNASLRVKVFGGLIHADKLYEEAAGTVIYDHVNGYVNINSGTSTGTGAQQTIAHGLAATPTSILLSESTTGGALAYQSAAADATNIYVLATLNKTWAWRAEI